MLQIEAGVSGVLIDYERIQFGVRHFGNTYFNYIKLFFPNCSVSADLKRQLFYHFSKEMVRRQAIRITIEA